MKTTIIIFLLGICSPPADIGGMSLLGVAIGNCKALWIAAGIVAATIIGGPVVQPITS